MPIWHPEQNISVHNSQGRTSSAHREEPPHNPNKSAQKNVLFGGNFYMVGTGIEQSLIWCLSILAIGCMFG